MKFSTQKSIISVILNILLWMLGIILFFSINILLKSDPGTLNNSTSLTLLITTVVSGLGLLLLAIILAVKKTITSNK